MKEKLHGGPTERTMIWLRNQGYTVAKVEHRLPFTNSRVPKTVDFCGFADIIAFKPGEIGSTAYQATDDDDPTGESGKGHVAARVRKILAEPRHRPWLQCGNRIQVIGWVKGSGSPTIEDITLETASAPAL